MTLGQHIQFLRKQAALSQEALGETLGVSRQAVSKWEADAAIPELDTLIAMSRLFGVTLGQLLQLEEPQPAEDPATAPQAVIDSSRLEELLRSYADQHQASRTRQRRLQWIAAGLGICLLTGGGFYAIGRIAKLQQNLYSLESQISNLRSSVNQEINDITSRISEAMEEQDNILAAHDLTATEVDIKNGAVRYHLTASLKEVNTASTGKFVLSYTKDDGKTGTVESEQLSGPIFEGYVWLPFNAYTDVVLLVTDPDGIQRTQKFGTILDAHESYFRLQGEAYAGYTTRSSGDGIMEFTVDGNYQIFAPDVPRDIDFPISLREVKMEIYHNDKLVDQAVMVPVDQSSSPPEAVIELVPHDTAVAVVEPYGQTQLYGLEEPFDFTLHVQKGDIIKAIFSMTDNYGRTTYETGDKDKAKEIIEEKGRLSIRPIALTEDMLPKK